MTELFAFHAAGRLAGIEPRHVHRVIDDVPVTPVPLVPPFHLGVCYHRGELFDILDAGAVLYSSPPGACTKNRRVILLKWDGCRLALLPNSVTGLVEYTDGETEKESIHLIDPEFLRRRALELTDGYV